MEDSSRSNSRGSNGCSGINGSKKSEELNEDNIRIRVNGQGTDGAGPSAGRENVARNDALPNGSASSSSHGCTTETNGTKGALKPLLLNSASAVSDEDSDDDYCVYTYKGDLRDQQRLADLPSSFYQFDTSDNQAEDSVPHPAERAGVTTSCQGRLNGSNGLKPVPRPTNGRNGEAPQNIFSPDMDFLEMDFDPSVYADPDGIESIDGDDIPSLLLQDATTNGWGSPSENADSSLRFTTNDPSHSPSTSRSIPSASAVAKKLNSVVLGGENINSLPTCQGTTVNATVSIASTSAECRSTAPPESSNVMSTRSSPCSNIVALVTPVENSNNNVHSENHVLRLVKSNTLPELNTKPATALPSSSSNFRPSERASILFSSGPVYRGCDPQWSYKARINTSEASAEDSVEVELRRVMIWDLAEAREMAVSQIGTSACGATAVLNVMRALKLEVSPEFVNECVGTRLRAETADLPEYLFSRSVAGATHTDLISGIRKASGDLIVGRFFSVKDMSVSSFSRWIVQWICKGAIPVVTRNCQVGSFASPYDIPDAWHHQMVFGVCPEGLFLNNPLECVSINKLLPELQSESVLLVRRHDILSRKGPTTDLRQLARHSDPRWNDMNVLGQVANILLEEIPYFCENTAARRVRSSHIKIPAGYKSGVTLFMLRESPASSLLLNGVET